MNRSHLDPETARMLADLERKNKESLTRIRGGGEMRPPGPSADRSALARQLSGIWEGRPELRSARIPPREVRTAAGPLAAGADAERVEIARRLSGIWVGRPDLGEFDGILRGLRKR